MNKIENKMHSGIPIIPSVSLIESLPNELLLSIMQKAIASFRDFRNVIKVSKKFHFIVTEFPEILIRLFKERIDRRKTIKYYTSDISDFFGRTPYEYIKAKRELMAFVDEKIQLIKNASIFNKMTDFLKDEGEDEMYVQMDNFNKLIESHKDISEKTKDFNLQIEAYKHNRYNSFKSKLFFWESIKEALKDWKSINIDYIQNRLQAYLIRMEKERINHVQNQLEICLNRTEKDNSLNSVNINTEG